MLSADTLLEKVQKDGFAICESVLSIHVVNELLVSLERISATESVCKRGGVFAIRNLLDVSPEVRALADSAPIRALVEPVLGSQAFPVRGIFFDKIPDANWKVPWHQDVTIAVQERIEAEGFGPWTIKSGVLHVQPPTFILEEMISVRLHLDNCNEENGALRVLPGSHREGRIPEEQIPLHCQNSREHICTADVGGALLMRPLLLHASSPSRRPDHRRVIHLDYAAIQLSAGMKWFSEVPHAS